MGFVEIGIIVVALVVAIQVIRHIVWPLVGPQRGVPGPSEPRDSHDEGQGNSVATTTNATAASLHTSSAERSSPESLDGDQFWHLIEAAWKSVDTENTRASLAIPSLSQDAASSLEDLLPSMLAQLRTSLARLTPRNLAAFDRILEEKLFELDRQSIHEVLDGSDDGFLYARGFVVAMGQAYFDSVLVSPQAAVEDTECEEFCYFPAELHEELYGTWPQHGTGKSRESFSNSAGWAE